MAIEGTGMSAATAVYFASTHATHLVHESSTRITVQVPPHADGTVHVRVMGPGGRSPETAGDRYQYVLHAPALRWSVDTSIDPDAGELTSVSCPSTSFCAAVGSAGLLHVYRNGAWSRVGLPSSDLNGVSCTSSTFCVAVEGFDQPVYTYDGSSWSPGAKLNLTNVSCTSPTFCLATGEEAGTAYTFDGTRWTPTTRASNQNLAAVACSSPTRCVAATDLGDADSSDDVVSLLTYDGAGWARKDWSGSHSAALSCPPGASFCVVVNKYGRAERFSGAFHPAAADSSDAGVIGLSCADPTSCVAVLDNGTTERYDITADTWSAPVNYDSHQSAGQSYRSTGAVSCATRSVCTAVDQDGYAYRGADADWTGMLVEQPTGSLDDASCASTTSCTAVDAAGNALKYNGRTWSAPVNVAGLASLSRVSCPTADFCAALGEPQRTGRPAQYRYQAAVEVNGRWQQSATTISVGDAVDDLSCSSADLCVATTDGGRAIAYKHGSWQAPQQVDAAARSLTSVSCPSDDFCLAGDDLGHEVSYNGSTWSAPAGTGAHGNGFFSMSCANEYYCVSGSDLIRIRRNGVWGDAGVSGFGDGQYSCPTTTFCLDLAGSDDSPRNYTFNGAAVVNGGIQLANPGIVCASPSLCFAIEGEYVETGTAK